MPGSFNAIEYQKRGLPHCHILLVLGEQTNLAQLAISTASSAQKSLALLSSIAPSTNVSSLHARHAGIDHQMRLAW